MWFCELFMEGGDCIFPDFWWFSWPENGVARVVFDFVCYPIPLSHQLSLFSLTLCLSLALSHSPVSLRLNMWGCTTCLCKGCCLNACSPSRSSVVVVIWLYCLQCVTCICPDSSEGVCFCSQCCKQGGAPFPNHPVGDVFFFFCSVGRCFVLLFVLVII